MIKNYDHVNTVNFQQFLNYFSQKYPKDFHVVQTDNASFHCANDLVMPDNVMLLYQPPHSPQVNSSEQLWQWSKGEIANKIVTNLDHLKTTLNDLFQSKSKEFFASLTSRKFISLIKGFLISKNRMVSKNSTICIGELYLFRHHVFIMPENQSSGTQSESPGLYLI